MWGSSPNCHLAVAPESPHPQVRAPHMPALQVWEVKDGLGDSFSPGELRSGGPQWVDTGATHCPTGAPAHPLLQAQCFE